MQKITNEEKKQLKVNIRKKLRSHVWLKNNALKNQIENNKLIVVWEIFKITPNNTEWNKLELLVTSGRKTNEYHICGSWKSFKCIQSAN